MNQASQAAQVFPSGQQNRPSPEALRRYVEGIFERQYYTESGPLVRRLEAELAQHFGVGHVIAISNPAVAWIMLLEAGLSSRRLLVPANAPSPLLEAINWMDCSQVVCDVYPKSGYRQQRADAELAIRDETDVIIGVNPWGGACDVTGLTELAQLHQIPIFFDSSESFACCLEEGPIGAFGQAEVFDLNAKNLLNGAGGACICTNDESLADRLRCMRSSGGVIRQAPVRKTVNGRMSEIQAAYALISLEQIDALIARNNQQHALYHQHLSPLPSLQILSGKGVLDSNHQQAVIALDGTKQRDALFQHLRSQGYPVVIPQFGADLYPQRYRLPGLTDLRQTAVELPLGSRIDADGIRALCGAIEAFFAGPHRQH